MLWRALNLIESLRLFLEFASRFAVERSGYRKFARCLIFPVPVTDMLDLACNAANHHHLLAVQF